MKRRDMIRWMGTAAGVLATGPASRVLGAGPEASPRPDAPKASFPDVVWVENGEPAALLAAAMGAIGGLGRFVSRGDVVVIKPNMAWDRAPELGATTNPELVAELVKLCFEAGAKTVRIFDRTCNAPLRCYDACGIPALVEKLGAQVRQIDDARFVRVALKQGERLKEWSFYRDYLDADRVINVPIAKHHSIATATLGIKNLMGVMGGDRGELHDDMATRLVDVTSAILPTLTIVDAYRVLLRNGPQGGDPGDVKLARTLVVSPCTVAADHVAVPVLGLTPGDVGHLGEAARRGLARVPLDRMVVRKIKLT